MDPVGPHVLKYGTNSLTTSVWILHTHQPGYCGTEICCRITLGKQAFMNKKKLFMDNLSAKYFPFIRSLSKCILFPTSCSLTLGNSECCAKVEQRWGGGDVEVEWLSGLCNWVREVCIRCPLDPVGPGYQSTRHTVMSSHGHVVTRSTRHTRVSSQSQLVTSEQ